MLYDALEVRDALNNTRSLQDRARTAHRAVEAHVERCAAAVEKALANPIAIHRASPEALRVAGHITRAGSMVASMAGIQPIAKTLNWAGLNLQQSAASAAHVREFGGVERTARDVETTRHLVRAALDPAYAKTQEALISKNEEQFSFVRHSTTPSTATRGGLKTSTCVPSASWTRASNNWPRPRDATPPTADSGGRSGSHRNSRHAAAPRGNFTTVTSSRARPTCSGGGSKS